jgi:hypothetical protein
MQKIVIGDCKCGGIVYLDTLEPSVVNPFRCNKCKKYFPRKNNVVKL